MNENIRELAVLWRRYTEETRDARKVPDESVTDDMRKKELLYFKPDIAGFMNWLANQSEA